MQNLTFAEQAHQLTINAQRIQRENKARCAFIDRTADTLRSGNHTKRPGRYYPPTIHDYAVQNPIAAALVKRLQEKYMK